MQRSLPLVAAASSSGSLISASACGNTTVLAQSEHDDLGQLHIGKLKQGELDEMNEKGHARALPCRRCDVETDEKEISAQNCADVLTRALALSVFR